MVKNNIVISKPSDIYNWVIQPAIECYKPTLQETLHGLNIIVRCDDNEIMLKKIWIPDSKLEIIVDRLDWFEYKNYISSWSMEMINWEKEE